MTMKQAPYRVKERKGLEIQQVPHHTGKAFTKVNMVTRLHGDCRGCNDIYATDWWWKFQQQMSILIITYFETLHYIHNLQQRLTVVTDGQKVMFKINIINEKFRGACVDWNVTEYSLSAHSLTTCTTFFTLFKNKIEERLLQVTTYHWRLQW